MIELLTLEEVLIIVLVGGPWSVGIQALGKFVLEMYKLWLWRDLAEVEE
jgi:hypothetical protein